MKRKSHKTTLNVGNLLKFFHLSKLKHSHQKITKTVLLIFLPNDVDKTSLKVFELKEDY